MRTLLVNSKLWSTVYEQIFVAILQTTSYFIEVNDHLRVFYIIIIYIRWKRRRHIIKTQDDKLRSRSHFKIHIIKNKFSTFFSPYRIVFSPSAILNLWTNFYSCKYLHCINSRTGRYQKIFFAFFPPHKIVIRGLCIIVATYNKNNLFIVSFKRYLWTNWILVCRTMYARVHESSDRRTTVPDNGLKTVKTKTKIIFND